MALLVQCHQDHLVGISKNFKDKSKFASEGVEGKVDIKEMCVKNYLSIKGGLRSSMGYIGAKNLNQIIKERQIY